jgi:hypothetical protein
MPVESQRVERPAQAVLDIRAYQNRKWLRKVLKQLGTPEAKSVVRQLDAWLPEQWPQS